MLAQRQPIEERGGSIAMESLARLLVGPHLQRSIVVAFGAVFLVLLIACANVANLLFAQALHAERNWRSGPRLALAARVWSRNYSPAYGGQAQIDGRYFHSRERILWKACAVGDQ